jgi:collagenase-like PrtC family protease
VIDQQRAEKALDYLAHTDEVCAKAKSYMQGLEKQEKTLLAVEILKVEGTQQHKEATARVTESYRNWTKQYEEAVYDFEVLRNRRTTAELLIEFWRSLNANRRGGNVV